MKAVNPATGELIRDYPDHDEAQIEATLARAESAFASWRKVPFAERSRLMTRVADLLRDRAGDYGRLITEEMGKPIAASDAEIDKCAWVCDFYAEHAERFLSPETVATDATRSFVRYDPLGPVLAIMPWNFPFWQLFRFAAPALMAGNVGLLKHASNVPGCALAIEEVFRDAGFPAGTMSTLLVSSETAKRLISHPVIRAVTLTGSEKAGVEVATEAGRNLKKTVLELGGSDPFIVLGDVDQAETAKQAAKARTINSGQSCIAAKRFLVEEPIADRFEEEFVQAMAALKVGDPMDRGNDVGPMAREDLLTSLDDQVQRTVAAGASAPAGTAWKGRASTTRRPSSPASSRACRPLTRRPSAPWRPSPAPATPTTPSSSPTAPPSASAPASGPAIRPAAKPSPPRSNPAASSSTAW